jgi:hypothetical protein
MEFFVAPSDIVGYLSKQRRQIMEGIETQDWNYVGSVGQHPEEFQEEFLVCAVS